MQQTKTEQKQKQKQTKHLEKWLRHKYWHTHKRKVKYKKELRREKVLMLGEGAVLFIGSLGQWGWWGQFWDFLFFSLFNFITFQFIKTIFFSCNVTSRIPWLWNMMGGCDAGILAGKLQWCLKQMQWAHLYNLIYIIERTCVCSVHA